MGGMDGFELIKTVRATGSKAKTIVMSGFCGYSTFSEQNFDGFLAKPFDIMRLQSMVSQLLSNAIPASGYQEASVPASKVNRPSK